MSVDDARQIAAALLESFFRELGEKEVSVAIRDSETKSGTHEALVMVGGHGTPDERIFELRSDPPSEETTK